jgi:hypothetical protein
MRFGVALLSVCVAACAGTLPHPRYVPQPASALIEVTSPAPPGRIEEIPPRPTIPAGTPVGALMVWVDGEWSRRRERWAWLPGAWVLPPAGWALSPWVFVRGADGRMWYAPSTWYDDHGVARTEPAPLALARVENTAVVNAGGANEATGPVLKRPATPAPGRPNPH